MSKIRQACVEGQFYNGNAERLHKSIDSFAADCAVPENPDPVRALILPHAGYVFSGHTAVAAMLCAKAFDYSRVLLIAPSHRVPFRGVAVSDYDAYSTLFGKMNIDSAGNERLLNSPSPFILNLNGPHANEHALEVQLPLIQHILSPELKIIPLICGQIDNRIAGRIATELIEFFTSDTLWVISSDFTHYGRNFNYLPFTENVQQNLRELDLGAAGNIMDFDPEGFEHYCNQSGATICGADPIKILLNVLNLAGGKAKFTAELIEYTTSGELTGDWSHCVSYASMCFREKA